MHQLAIILLLFLMSPAAAQINAIHHYIFFNREREWIVEKSFLETPAFEGAQLKYAWKELEPEKDRYNFSMIPNDLDFLTANGKKLFIQLQDVTFDTSLMNVPAYLLKDSTYRSGVRMP